MVLTFDQLQNRIIQKSSALGFDALGFVNDLKPAHSDYFLAWLRQKKHAHMTWLEKHADKRLSPEKIFPGVRSAIVALVNYHHRPPKKDFAVARYAHGEDYHIWFKNMLEELAVFIQQEAGGGFLWRSFVDTGPLLERDLAAKAGLGWIGKNTCLINEELGSFAFLGVILTNLEFSASQPSFDQCGTCSLCIDSCPTQALEEYRLDAGKCLAYHNIEKRGKRDERYWASLENHLVGCDICQDVCPWNQKAPLTRRQVWLDNFSDYTLGDFEEILRMSRAQYQKKFRTSAISRIRYDDFMRNVFVVIANLKRCDLLSEVMAWRERHKELDMEEWEYCAGELKKCRSN